MFQIQQMKSLRSKMLFIVSNKNLDVAQQIMSKQVYTEDEKGLAWNAFNALTCTQVVRQKTAVFSPFREEIMEDFGD